MEGWKSINEIIANFKQKKSVSKHLALNIIQDFLNERFKPKERTDLNIKRGVLEIKTQQTILAQEIALNKEEIKNSLNELLKKIQKERKIDFSEFLIKEIVLRRK